MGVCILWLMVLIWIHQCEASASHEGRSPMIGVAPVMPSLWLLDYSATG